MTTTTKTVHKHENDDSVMQRELVLSHFVRNSVHSVPKEVLQFIIELGAKVYGIQYLSDAGLLDPTAAELVVGVLGSNRLGTGQVGRTSIIHRYVHQAEGKDFELPEPPRVDGLKHLKWPFEPVEYGLTTNQQSDEMLKLMEVAVPVFSPVLFPWYGAQKLVVDDRQFTLRVKEYSDGGMYLDRGSSLRMDGMDQSLIAESHAMLVVFSVVDRESFKHAESHLEVARHYCLTAKRDPIYTVLVGNKIDLKKERAISTEEGAQFAKKWGVEYAEMSAKTGENVLETFEATILHIVKHNSFGRIHHRDHAPRNLKKSRRCVVL